MIGVEDLRVGNRVFWKPHIGNSTILIQVEIIAVLKDKVGYIRSHLEHRVEPFEDDEVTTEIPFALYNDIEPIPVKKWLDKQDKKIDHPMWIQYLHELQNWYYWNNERKELELGTN